MSASASNRGELGNTGYEIFIGALSVLSLVNLVLLTTLDQSAALGVVRFMDVPISIIFLADFAVRLHRAEDRSAYFFRSYGWADLLASLPFPQVKVMRVFRLVRVIRVMRRVGVGGIVRSLIRDRAGSAFLSVVFVAMLVLEFGSIGMLRLERGSVDANITTTSDAIWYVIATISTVGYGDVYPTTTSGRELGVFIIIIGVALFGTLTGFLANLFLAPRPRASEDGPAAAVDAAARRVAELQDLVARQQKALAELDMALREPA
jgi:voltage-gated potassium channel